MLSEAILFFSNKHIIFKKLNLQIKINYYARVKRFKKSKHLTQTLTWKKLHMKVCFSEKKQIEINICSRVWLFKRQAMNGILI